MTIAEVEFRINGGAPTYGGITVPSGATVKFLFPNTVGWQRYRLELYGPPGWTPPGGWTVEQGAIAVYTGVATPPPDLTLPAASVRWGKWMVVLTVNDTLQDARSGLSMLSPDGLEDLGVRESTQFHGSVRRWVGSIQNNLRVPPPGGGGGGPTVVEVDFTAMDSQNVGVVPIATPFTTSDGTQWYRMSGTLGTDTYAVVNGTGLVHTSGGTANDMHLCLRLMELVPTWTGGPFSVEILADTIGSVFSGNHQLVIAYGPKGLITPSGTQGASLAFINAGNWNGYGNKTLYGIMYWESTLVQIADHGAFTDANGSDLSGRQIQMGMRFSPEAMSAMTFAQGNAGPGWIAPPLCCAGTHLSVARAAVASAPFSSALWPVGGGDNGFAKTGNYGVAVNLDPQIQISSNCSNTNGAQFIVKKLRVMA